MGGVADKHRSFGYGGIGASHGLTCLCSIIFASCVMKR